LFPATAGGTGSSATVVEVVLVDVLLVDVLLVDVTELEVGVVVLTDELVVVVGSIVVDVVLVVEVLVVVELDTTVGSVDVTVGSESTADRVHAASTTNTTINVLRPTGRLSQVGRRGKRRVAGQPQARPDSRAPVALGEVAPPEPD
jgi:hypothetical protein